MGQPMQHQLSTFNHLLQSFYHVRLGKREKPATLSYNYQLESHLFYLQYLLNNNAYVPYPYKYFIITEPKKRHIAAPHFRDRIVHRALVTIIEPQLDKQFIYDSYACRKDKGTHLGLQRVKKFVTAARCKYGKGTPIYVLKCDIEKYFASVSWDILLTILKRTITDPYLFPLIETIITDHKVFKVKGQLLVLPEHVVSVETRKGIPIGNLTSQLFANVYLSELDQYVKHTLKEHWYARYMDDFLLIHPDKEHLKKVRDQIRVFLRDHLGLSLHPKKVSIQEVSHGVTFVGYRIFYDHILVRSKTKRRFQKRFNKRIKAAAKGKFEKEKLTLMVDSFMGHLKHADTWGLKHVLFRNLASTNDTTHVAIIPILKRYHVEKATLITIKQQRPNTVYLQIQMNSQADALDFIALRQELCYAFQKQVELKEFDSHLDIPYKEREVLRSDILLGDVS